MFRFSGEAEPGEGRKEFTNPTTTSSHVKKRCGHSDDHKWKSAYNAGKGYMQREVLRNELKERIYVPHERGLKEDGEGQERSRNCKKKRQQGKYGLLKGRSNTRGKKGGEIRENAGRVGGIDNREHLPFTDRCRNWGDLDGCNERKAINSPAKQGGVYMRRGGRKVS